jgi:hypothetical protein
MIVLSMAAALLATAQAEPTPLQMGRAAFLAGTCATLGWESSRQRVAAAGEAYDVRHPPADPAVRQAEILEGIQAARADMRLIVDAFRSTGDVAAFKEAVASRCDSVARDMPGMLNRTEGTQAAFDAAIAAQLSRMAGDTPPP